MPATGTVKTPLDNENVLVVVFVVNEYVPEPVPPNNVCVELTARELLFPVCNATAHGADRKNATSFATANHSAAVKVSPALSPDGD